MRTDLKVMCLVRLCNFCKVYLNSGWNVKESLWARFPHVIPIWPFCLPSHPKYIQPTTMFGRCTVSHKYLHVKLQLTYSSHLKLTNTIHSIFISNPFWRAVPLNRIINFREKFSADAECSQNRVRLWTWQFSISRASSSLWQEKQKQKNLAQSSILGCHLFYKYISCPCPLSVKSLGDNGQGGVFADQNLCMHCKKIKNTYLLPWTLPKKTVFQNFV